MKNLSKVDLINGNKAFEKHEKRDAMYSVASFLVEQFWGKPDKMADGLGVLLLTWNQAFYRYGGFDFDKLESWIKDNLSTLKKFRKRRIKDLSKKDEAQIMIMFNSLLDALKGERGRSPVAVAKALHILVPDFFPLWDVKISKAPMYKCHWYKSENAAKKYIDFCLKIKDIVNNIGSFQHRKPILKIIDEYNYAKFTRGWI